VGAVADALAAALVEMRTRKGPRCSLGRALANLTGEDVTDLVAALDARDEGGEYVYSHAFMARFITSLGTKVGTDAVSRHRRGECSDG
jgi:hypothetical protein